MENKEIQEQCNQIKDKLNELGFTEFTLYAADYCGELDEELVEKRFLIRQVVLNGILKTTKTIQECLEFAPMHEKLKSGMMNLCLILKIYMMTTMAVGKKEVIMKTKPSAKS